jgi:hypothetical protein
VYRDHLPSGDMTEVQQSLTLESDSRGSLRDLVFISHATPEDNDFARWLALKLATAGYKVWADVEQLIGGEKFWNDIEEAIRDHAAQVLFCGSKIAMKKPGVLKELDIALKAEKSTGKDLVIPLKLDDVAYQEFPSGIATEVNIVPFHESWAVGLARILKILDRAKVPQRTDGPEVVSSWWKHRFSPQEGVEDGTEIHLTNLFPVVESPAKLNYFECNRPLPPKFGFASLPFAARPYGQGIITTAEENEVQDNFGAFGIRFKSSTPWTSFAESGWEELEISPREAQKRLYWMLRFGFERTAKARNFQPYAMAQGNQCFWLLKSTTRGDQYFYTDLDGSTSRRALVGYQSYGISKDGVKPQRFWHFAIQPKPLFGSVPGLVLKSHVVFTEDGKTLIESDARQHSARRSACKSWWNDSWRDRILAAAAYLAGDSGHIGVQLSEQATAKFSCTPLLLNSTKTFKVSEKQPFEKIVHEDEGTDEETE